jgi:G:T-mismatch repair DNA endonuclease (very short patch repair protein)
MSTKRYQEASLQLPAQAPKLGDASASTVEEALVDISAYIVDERNNTTAISQTRDGIEIQVSFFLAQPPRVSFFCVSCTNNQPTELSSEPRLVATEGNLALFLLKHGPFRTGHEYYIYRAPVAAVDGVLPVLEKVASRARKSVPSLWLILLP